MGQINSMMETTIAKIREMADAKTIIGEPINGGEGITIIPVSKVSFGFGTGGSDFNSKKTDKVNFGGGGGAGMTISPIAFLVISNGDVRLMELHDADNTADRAVNAIPEIIDKVSAMVKNRKPKDKTGDSTEGSDV